MNSNYKQFIRSSVVVNPAQKVLPRYFLWVILFVAIGAGVAAMLR